MSCMERQETSSPEIARIIKNFECHTVYDLDIINILYHFKTSFLFYVKKVFEWVEVNHFLQDNHAKIR